MHLVDCVETGHSSIRGLAVWQGRARRPSLLPPVGARPEDHVSTQQKQRRRPVAPACPVRLLPPTAQSEGLTGLVKLRARLGGVAAGLQKRPLSPSRHPRSLAVGHGCSPVSAPPIRAGLRGAWTRACGVG